MSRSQFTTSAVLALIVAAILGANAQSVPQACVNAAGSIQSGCSSDIQKAAKSLGVSVNTADSNSLISAANSILSSGRANEAISALNPSSGCCKASCEFTRQLCGCNQDVVNLVESTLKIDSGTLARLLSQFSSKCGFPAYSKANGNCPSTASFSC